MELCVLGSGSSGNSSLLRANGTPLLIDAGFGPRAILKRLDGCGVTVPELRGILLTHLDRDHFSPTWFDTLLKFRIPVYCHTRHLHGIYQHAPTTRSGVNARTLYEEGLLHTFNDQPFSIEGVNGSGGPIRVRPIHLAHDKNGVVGFRINTPDGDLGYATDLGRVPDALIEAFTDVQILAFESNYDPPSQIASSRPDFLKHRIMGGSGHLSNEQAFDAVTAILERSTRPPQHIVLLHLSRQCNSPSIVSEVFQSHANLEAAPRRLTISSQTQRTEWLRLSGDGVKLPGVVPGEQLPMFEG
jgi:phosphoribosyl 1,2-cyclic phosphodiesterase